MKLNIYQFDFDVAKDWVIATSKKSAKEIHQNITDIPNEDYDSCKISFIKKKDWNKFTYVDEEERMSFKEFMENEAFKEEFFCSTEY